MLTPTHPRNLYIYILINITPNTLFSPNVTIIITGTFRNTSNYMKYPYFAKDPQLIIRCYSLYESAESLLSARCMNFKCVPHNFYCRDLKFSDIVLNIITIINKN